MRAGILNLLHGHSLYILRCTSQGRDLLHCDWQASQRSRHNVEEVLHLLS